MSVTLIAREGAVIPQYAELALEPLTWDVAVPIRWIYAGEALVQRIRCRLQFWHGEWYLDQRLGVPYRRRIFGRGRQLSAINALLSRAIRETPGIRNVKSFTSEFDRPTRTLTSSFEAELAEGTLLAVQDEPFILLPQEGPRR